MVEELVFEMVALMVERWGNELVAMLVFLLVYLWVDL
jgi:hypothetical protein